MWFLFREGVQEFFADNALSRGAAISFYAMTAMGPVFYICATVAGIFLGNREATTHLIYEVRRVVGHDTAATMEAAIQASKLQGGFWPTLFGVIVLVLTAGGVFVEVQSALNAIWKAPEPPFSYWRMIKTWAQSIALVAGLGVLLCCSLIINAAVGAFGHYFHNLFGIGGGIVWLLNFAVSTSLICFLFAAIYRLLPNRALQWGDVITGAVVTTGLILIGEYLIAFYLAETALAHRYGSAGGAMAILIWLYYSVQVFLLGAEITKVWSRRHGSPAARAIAAARYRLDKAL
ncbi:membrane protein [Rhizomicrobium palustre]|uniref:Membrane protein n=1 Tax=Rhizomicrobium palustre TaxID=189966 RepID=A0A846MYM4_9PROT|nr:YihY/virulence factor BrkB family protein [Rhizomicrobium palustre]NIK88728.1 membrane protein [Rhizomicrobium palustre]